MSHDHFRNLLKDLSDLNEAQAQAAVAWVIRMAIQVSLVLVLAGAVFAVVPVNPYGPFATPQTTVRAHLTLLLTGSVRFTLGAGLALVAGQGLELSAYGRRLGNLPLAQLGLFILAGLVLGGAK